MNNGFDYYYGYNHWASQYYNDNNVWEDFKHVGVQKEYNTDAFTDKALDFMEAQIGKKDPFSEGEIQSNKLNSHFKLKGFLNTEVNKYVFVSYFDNEGTFIHAPKDPFYDTYGELAEEITKIGK